MLLLLALAPWQTLLIDHSTLPLLIWDVASEVSSGQCIRHPRTANQSWSSQIHSSPNAYAYLSLAHPILLPHGMGGMLTLGVLHHGAKDTAVGM